MLGFGIRTCFVLAELMPTAVPAMPQAVLGSEAFQDRSFDTILHPFWQCHFFSSGIWGAAGAAWHRCVAKIVSDGALCRWVLTGGGQQTGLPAAAASQGSWVVPDTAKNPSLIGAFAAKVLSAFPLCSTR